MATVIDAAGQETTFDVTSLCHPSYLYREKSWVKWRLMYEGGDEFIDAYLQRYSKSELVDDFNTRKSISYLPAFAKSSVIEIRNSIYQRLCDISRIGGSKSWQEAVAGRENGVDLIGSSMNNFMGTKVLEELIVMGKVGIYIDMPEVIPGSTIIQNRGIRPYLYIYKAEDIRSWSDDDSPTPNRYQAVLLRDTIYVRSNPLNLPCGVVHRYRYYWKAEDGSIWVQFYDNLSRKTDQHGNPLFPDPIRLNISKIPFVCLDLNASLCAEIANYQIAMLNLASADMAYAVGANFPFYTEQFDPRGEASHLKGRDTVATVTNPELEGGGVSVNESAPNQTVTVGPASGRRYSKGLDRPGFVSPPTDPMRASMEKQRQMREEIRLLINLAISDLQPKMASAESKGLDSRSLESGLSYIGLVLEDGERQTASIWHEYELSRMPYLIKYPDKYNIRSDADIFAEVNALKAQLPEIVSITAQRVIAKRIIELLIGHRVTPDILDKIFKEIDDAEVISILVEKIEKDVAGGYLDPELAAKLRTYPKSTVKKAQEFQAERIKTIQASQAPNQGMGAVAGNGNPAGLDNPAARGVKDISPTPAQDAAKEKQLFGGKKGK